MTPQEFIDRWARSGASERANYQLFLSELCEMLGVEPPHPQQATEAENAYVFEKNVPLIQHDGTQTTGRIDLYKRGHFIIEAKQGSDEGAERKGHGTRGTGVWDKAMVRAKKQAENYIHALPASEGRPPFLIVVDVGFSIQIYSEFTCTGGTYIPFPEPRTHKIPLQDLAREDTRELLRSIWEKPLSLDPARRSARVTREIAEKLARLAKSLEASGHTPALVGGFLMRCIFTMFAEDVNLIEKNSFRSLLESIRNSPQQFVPLVQSVWDSMNEGGFCIALRQTLLKFNGGLFDNRTALPVTKEQLDLIIEAAKADWREVEPAIFGTLLERALDPRERHKLGAHYTPRDYVERLVMPTVIDPLRAEWDNVQAAAAKHLADEALNKAVEAVRTFRDHLCTLKVLDPACGSGNFLYVTMEHMKRLEGEVLDLLHDLGESQTGFELEGHTVHPTQFLGIELNPRAAVLAELCLWIGYLQWHFRTKGAVNPPEPVISKFHTIECRDAVLAYDAAEPIKDDNGKYVTRWDGHSMKKHPVTGEDVPDESATIPVYQYKNPRQATWPPCDYIVGNPPFIGTARMRDALGDGYAETIRKAYPDVPESVDFVMYWWHKAAELTRTGKVKGFGFITTNSLRQTFNRRVIQHHMNDAEKALSLRFAIPDHPWVDSADAAAVRIAMTVGTPATAGKEGTLATVAHESEGEDGSIKVELTKQTGEIHSNLVIGANVASAVPLQANGDLSCPGVKLHGSGFIISREEASNLGLGTILGLEKHIREYRNGKDLTERPRDVMVIDLFGLDAEQVRNRFPAVYQWVYDRVKPERDQNKRDSYKLNWWIHGEPRKAFRPALKGLPRYIATVETSKHRFFQFLDEIILPDNRLVCIAHSSAWVLGVLSSHTHFLWTQAQGGTLGPATVYNKTRCFETFPFPVLDESQKASIRRIAEQLDTHRKRQIEQHPELTMTGLYNVLEKLRAGEPLTAKDKAIHDKGLVSVLRELHDELDTAVAEAYGWSPALSDQAILQNLVALNQERAAEEANGIIRYLRPEYQNPEAAQAARQSELIQVSTTTKPARTAPATVEKLPWPETVAEQVAAVRDLIRKTDWSSEQDIKLLATHFKGVRPPKVQAIVEALITLGQAT